MSRRHHAAASPTRAYSWYALGLLALINLLNYIDRNVIFALFEPIKRDLALTDSQLGWLGSAYILVFSVAALPFGVLSDLRSRRAVIAGGVTRVERVHVPERAGQQLRPALHLPRGWWAWARRPTGRRPRRWWRTTSPARGRAVAMGILSSGIALGGVLGLLLGGLLEADVRLAGGVHDGGRAGIRLRAPGLAPGRSDPDAGAAHGAVVPPGLRDRRARRCSATSGRCSSAWRSAASAAWWLDRAYGADSKVDIAAFSAAVGLGLALTICAGCAARQRTPATTRSSAAASAARSTTSCAPGRTVLHTPTLVYIFSGRRDDLVRPQRHRGLGADLREPASWA